MLHHRARHGTTNVQWIVIAALITAVIVVSVATIGTRTSTKLNETATDVATPSSLVNRFGS